MTDSATTLVGVLKPRSTIRSTIRQGIARHENGLCITTNRVEGFFGILKRGINGVYHHVGQQHFTDTSRNSTTATTRVRKQIP